MKRQGGDLLAASRANRLKLAGLIRTTDRKTCRIATIPGDGTGKEVIPAGQQILEVLAVSESSFRFEFENFNWGGDNYRKNDVMMPAGGLNAPRGGCFSLLCSSIDPFCKRLKDRSRVCIQSGVAESPLLQGGLAEIAQDIFKRDRSLAPVPGPLDGSLWGGAMAGLCVSRQDRVIEIEDQRSGSLRGLGDTVLRVFQAEKLLHVAEIRHFRLDPCRLEITAAWGCPQSGASRTCLA